MAKLLRPSVIRSSEWDKREERDPEKWRCVREQVLRRDRWTCVYCRFRASKFMMVNHIGSEDNHTIENLETVCKPCHSVLHMGVNAMKGYVSVLESDASQTEIVRTTRALICMRTSWTEIEKQILAQFLPPLGKVYDREESIAWANRMLASIAPEEYRAYLPDGLAVIFHEEGVWEAVKYKRRLLKVLLCVSGYYSVVSIKLK
jgi:hypothetical protein